MDAFVLRSALLKLLRRFGSDGITAIPYKGPVLAARLYGNIALRHTGDLDIFIRKEDVSSARELLLADGFHRQRHLSPAAEAFQLRAMKSEAFHQEHHAVVELHWAFADEYFPFPLDFDTLAQRLVSIPVSGDNVPGFANEDLLLILCVHGWKHCWDRLEWVCGIAELQRSGNHPLDWETVLRQAAALRCRRMLLFGLRLASELLDAPLPPPIHEMVRSEQGLSGAVAAVRRLMSEGGQGIGSLARRDVFRSRLLDGSADRLRFLAFRLAIPDPSDWILLTVGSHVVPVHALIQPLRRTAKVGVRAVRRLLPSADPVGRW